MRFPSGLAAHLHLSWLDPHKERRFTVVGSKRMATFDDMEVERKLTVYDKGFDQDWLLASASTSPARATSGAPRSANEEPLRIECAPLRRVRSASGEAPRSDGASGLRVVRVLEELQQSLDENRRADLTPSDRAPGLLLGDGRRRCPPTPRSGGNVVIHAGTVLGAGVRVQDGAVVGKPLALGAHSTRRARRAAARPRSAPARRSARARSWWPAHGSAAGAVVGDQAHVRERAVVGDETVVGRGSPSTTTSSIGARVRIQTGCYITAFSTIEDDVFVAPGRDADQRRHDGPPRARPRAARGHAPPRLPRRRRRRARSPASRSARRHSSPRARS